MANKVYNDLVASPFFVKVNDYEFKFSSVFKQKKFKNEWKDYIKNQQILFEAKYKIDVDLSDLFLIALYKRIENRGSLIYYQEMVFDSEKLKVIIV